MQIPPVYPRPPYLQREGSEEHEKVTQVDRSHRGRRDMVSPVQADRRRKDRRRQNKPVAKDRRRGERRRARQRTARRFPKFLRYSKNAAPPEQGHEPGEIVDQEV